MEYDANRLPSSGGGFTAHGLTTALRHLCLRYNDWRENGHQREEDAGKGCGDLLLCGLHCCCKWGPSLPIDPNRRHPERPRSRRLRHALHALNVFLLVFVTAAGFQVLFDTVNPFGFATVTEIYSEQIADRILAPFYHSEAGDRIVVVLLADAFDEEYGWPPQYATYAQLLGDILAMGPKEVFVDLTFPRPRPDDPTLPEARAILKDAAGDGDIPLFFAAYDPKMPNIFSGVPGYQAAQVSWMEDDYPLSLPADDGTRHDTAGYALYREFTKDTGDAPDDADYTDKLVVRWKLGMSNDAAHSGLNAYLSPSLTEPAGLPARAQLAARLFGESLIVGIAPDRLMKHREHSLPFLTFEATQFNDPASMDKLWDKIDGAVVLVGTNIPGNDDFVPTPTHGRLPGVYLHAMALDNLLTYHDDYYRRSWPGFLIDGATFSLLAALITFFRMLLPRHRWLLQISILVLMGGITWALCVVFRQAPENWIAVLFSIGIALRASAPGNFSHTAA